ncbi:hypothetical protein OQA88_12725 [Cercophora sp. LCS_1]
MARQGDCEDAPWAEFSSRRLLASDEAGQWEGCVEFVRGCLEQCSSTHQTCIDTDVEGVNPAQLLEVIDDTHVRLIDTDPAIKKYQYTALSYCHDSLENKLIPSTPTAISNLPSLFRNAIALTRALKFFHIYIPSVCTTKSTSLVFTNAHLTLAAATAPSPTSPLLATRVTPRTITCQSTNSPITVNITANAPNTDWTHPTFRSSYSLSPAIPAPALQKSATAYVERLLSKRIVHFTDHETIWECSALCACECGEMQAGRSKGAFAFNPLLIDQKDGGEFYIWHLVVSQFTARAVRDEERGLVIGDLVGRFTGLGRYIFGIWEAVMVRDLLWVVSPVTMRMGERDDYAERGLEVEAVAVVEGVGGTEIAVRGMVCEVGVVIPHEEMEFIRGLRLVHEEGGEVAMMPDEWPFRLEEEVDGEPEAGDVVEVGWKVMRFLRCEGGMKGSVNCLVVREVEDGYRRVGAASVDGGLFEQFGVEETVVLERDNSDYIRFLPARQNGGAGSIASVVCPPNAETTTSTSTSVEVGANGYTTCWEKREEQTGAGDVRGEFNLPAWSYLASMLELAKKAAEDHTLDRRAAAMGFSIDDGNSTRPPTRAELLQKFGILRCGSDSCETELDLVGRDVHGHYKIRTAPISSHTLTDSSIAAEPSGPGQATLCATATVATPAETQAQPVGWRSHHHHHRHHHAHRHGHAHGHAPTPAPVVVFEDAKAV